MDDVEKIAHHDESDSRPSNKLVARHDGKKGLYSQSTYDEQTFWSLYDRETYEALKRECGPTAD